MFKRLLPAALIGYIFLVIVNWGCTKLDTTTLGSDLIPVVDNVHTFADTLDIVTTQGVFDDTLKVTRNENNILGYISGDELFGLTEANMYMQFKPQSAFPFYFGNAGDTLVGVDSVVLCLGYGGFWGDSVPPVHLEVRKIDQQNFVDSPNIFRNIKYVPGTFSDLLGSTDVYIQKLKDTIRLRGDSVNNQIRIKLSSTYAAELFERDTAASSTKNAFRNDSLYRRYHNGFAITATSGNSIMYISPSDAKTRLDIYFRRKKANTGALDTTVNSFTVNTSSPTFPSATTNYIKRTFTPEVISPSTPSLYMVTGPGTYANLKIPQLDTIGNAAGTHNRIVHRAEIYMEQEPQTGNTDDSIFSAPAYMYLDLVDTGATKWKPIYYDLSPNEPYDPDFKKPGYPYFPGSGGVDFNYFGGFARTRFNYTGEKVVYYTLNTTRHVQQILTKGTPNYTMRMFPAYEMLYPQHTASSGSIPFNNPLARGRVRLKGGNYPDRLKKMRMVIIWSKI